MSWTRPGRWARTVASGPGSVAGCRRARAALKGRQTIRAPGCRRCAHRPDSSTRRCAPPLDRHPPPCSEEAPNGATAQTVAPPGQPTKEHPMSITFRVEAHNEADDEALASENAPTLNVHNTGGWTLLAVLGLELD